MKGKFLIEQYAGLAAGFLLLHQQTDAQVVYTDLEPDLVFQDDGDFSYIDMNGDGINEIGMLKSSYINSTFTTPGLNTAWYYKVALWVGPAVVGPEIAGESDHDSSAGGTYCFPYALNKEIEINNSLSFQNCGYQLLGSKQAEIYYDSSYTILGLGDWFFGQGAWDNTINRDSIRYIGVKFEDAENCLHYGWIRCVVMDSVDKLVVKDYAYEMQCNKPILAGDTVSYVNIGSNNADRGVSIYSFNSQIYIHTQDIGNINIEVISISGQCIHTLSNSGSTLVIDMHNQPNGTYLVKVNVQDSYFAKKVIID